MALERIVGRECPFCMTNIEDLHHALFECPDILNTSIWHEHFPHLPKLDGHRYIRVYIQAVQELGTTKELDKLFIIAWSLWKRRNQFLFENEKIHIFEALRQALSMYAEGNREDQFE